MTNVVPIRTKKPSPRPTRPSTVRQFLIVLHETDPLVWRRIQVPARYTFWDLHVAMQDGLYYYPLLDSWVVVSTGACASLGIVLLFSIRYFPI